LFSHSRKAPLPLFLYGRDICSRTLCNTLQHTATHANTCQYTATHANIRQYTATHYNTPTHANTLQHTPKLANTLQHTTTYCNILRHCSTRQHTVAHGRIRQHTATHGNTHTADSKSCAVCYRCDALAVCYEGVAGRYIALQMRCASIVLQRCCCVLHRYSVCCSCVLHRYCSVLQTRRASTGSAMKSIHLFCLLPITHVVPASDLLQDVAGRCGVLQGAAGAICVNQACRCD